ncbi:MAG: UvrD-helicase domain-containing protein [Burkholderiales bacterium]|nr:UvrD-helicase domain-containing protein [Burkholderiales bacterium]
MNSTLLDHLNPEQLAAVTLGDESALILAGAGSGKTRVLTTRIAWLLSQGRVGPGGVMAVTFTNKAAKEMLTRLAAMLPYNVRGMWIGTFHGLCHRFLRSHWKAAGLPQGFQILDVSDSVAAVKRVIKAMNLDEERYVPKAVAHFIAHAKERAERPGDIDPRDAQERVLVEIYAAYEAQCQREGVVDFAELMLRTYELMRDDAALRSHYQQRFRHVLVDEFQDTNTLQYAWLKLFAAPRSSQAVMAVGDDDQSIYAFRGAVVANMHAFERDYGVRQLIKLEENYRSCGHILDAANHLIGHNERRLGKTLRTAAGQGEMLRVFEAPSDFEEARWVLEEAHAQHRAGTPRAQLAVLYRSNAQSRVIESALFNAGVPYRVYGGLRFFERAEIKHALAYLRLLENPNDDTSFLRVVNFPARAIGARSVEALQDAARASGRSLWQSVSAVTGRAGAALAGFVKLVEDLRAATEGQTLKQIVECVVEGSGLAAHYRSDKDGSERLENLDELITAAESFVTQEGFGRDAVALPVDELGPGPGLTPDLETGEIMSPLAAFLTHASLEAGEHQAQAGQDAVQLMTIHAAKGLEFDVVFLTGLEEGLFPNDRALEDHDGLEEERRLMYVAITRARKQLMLSLAQTRMLHGQTRYHLRSRFLDELPEASLKWLSPKQGGFGSGFQQPYASAWQRGGGSARAAQQPAWSHAAPPPPPPPPRKTEHDSGLRVGQAVFHNKFGEGAVLAIEGQGADARAHIQFGRHGSKWLALAVAKLTPI